MTKKVETRAFESRFEDTGDGMTCTGYASVFNRMADMGYYKEIIENGAFEGTDMTDVILTCEHNMSQPLARTLNQTLTLTIDDHGLKYTGALANTSYGRDVKELLSRKDITKSSFGFWVDEESWDYETDEMPIRRIKKISVLRDVGPVVNPAYTDTSADVRSKMPPNPKQSPGMCMELAKNILTINSNSITSIP